MLANTVDPDQIPHDVSPGSEPALFSYDPFTDFQVKTG